jgi:hypothetical protein
MKELAIFIAGLAILEVPLIWFLYQQHKTILEQSKLLASRTYTEYSLGNARVEKARQPEENASYEQAWENR